MKRHEMNCQNCRHYIRQKANFYIPDTPHNCAAGFNVEMQEWWDNNGHLPVNSESPSPMGCFVPHEYLVILDSMLEKVDGILELLSNKSKNEGNA